MGITGDLRRRRYYLGINGNADRPGIDEGEWRIMVSKRRSMWQRLTGTGRVTADETISKVDDPDGNRTFTIEVTATRIKEKS
jgi:hypothetical protein